MKLFKKTLAVIAATAVIVSLPLAAHAGEIPRTGTYVWGANASGSLGTGTTTAINNPELAKAADTNFPIAHVSTSATHSLYVDDKGNVYASGSNAHGELGNGTTTDSSVPVPVTLPLRYGVPDYATQVWTGNGVSYMEGGFGTVYAWGDNTNGMTGLGLTTGDTLTPQSTGLTIEDNETSTLAVGPDHVTAINYDPVKGSQLYAWGNNINSQLGNPNLTTDVQTTPTRILIPNPSEPTTTTDSVCTTNPDTEEETCSDVTTQIPYDQLTGLGPTKVANGNGFSVAVADGKIFTWGKNTVGQLGTASSTDAIVKIPTTSPALALENGSDVTSLSAGENHVILLASNGLLYGWGSNSNSQTAPYYSNTTGAAYLPVLQRLTILQENNNLSPWSYVIAAGNSSYAVTNAGEIYGWGDNTSHQLANLKTTVTTPTKIAFPYQTTVNSFAAGGGNVLTSTSYTETYTDLNLPTATFTAGTYDTAYTKTLAAPGGYPGNPHTWTISGLPAGLNYDAATGVITGKPTVVGTFDINYAVTDNVDTLSDTATLVINKAAATVTPAYTSTLPGKVTAKVTVIHGTTQATGSVRFYVGTKYTTVNLSKGAAATTLAYTAGTTQALKVVYNGSTVLNTATSASKSVKALAKWSATPKPTYSVKSRTVTVKVPALKSGTILATGSIYLYDGSKKIVAGTLKNGTVTFTKALTKGTHKLTVRYAGSSYFNAKNSAVKAITLK